MSNACVILANGFEEIEASAIIDILRRANIDLTIAGLDQRQITGAHQLQVNTDTQLSDCLNQNFDMIILPGGEPGSTNLEKNEQVHQILREQNQKGKWIAAICAAPRILDGLGFLDNKNATSYPTSKEDMQHCQYSEDRVVVDGHLITSRGPGTAMEFALKIVEVLASYEHSKQLQNGMLINV